jgi:hypothetical protein
MEIASFCFTIFRWAHFWEFVSCSTFIVFVLPLLKSGSWIDLRDGLVEVKKQGRG